MYTLRVGVALYLYVHNTYVKKIIFIPVLYNVLTLCVRLFSCSFRDFSAKAAVDDTYAMVVTTINNYVSAKEL